QEIPLEQQKEIMLSEGGVYHEQMQELASHSGVQLEMKLLKGTTVEVLRDLSLDPELDLIVMGTTGQSGWLGKWLGSTSASLARRSHTPVMLVPQDARFKRFSSIAYASAHQPGELQLISELLGWAKHYDSELHLVHVHQNKEVAFRVANSYCLNLFDKRCTVISSVDSQQVWTGLISYASEKESDLLVASTMHRNFISDLLHTSVTREIASQTTLPLLVLHYDQ
ncbi:MAG: universal stress protein, partial [Saprospiraceae bacterium]|nr:universal stress protein [Saprospiraceae bacterium]